VFVVNRVKLIAFHQPQQMGKLNGNCSRGLQQEFQAANEVDQVRHMSEDIVRDDQVGLLAFRLQFRGGVLPKKLRDCRNSFPHSRLCDILRRLHTQDRNIFFLEVLQQITVVAGDFDDQAPRVQSEPGGGGIGIPGGMSQPRFGKRRKIGVITKDCFWKYKLLHLHKEASAAHPRVQRKERLHFVQLLSTKEGVRKRGHPEVCERVLERRIAKPARKRTHVREVSTRFGMAW
jgi:hypothetical protein